MQRDVPSRMTGVYGWMKRVFDIVVSTLMIICLAPVFLVVAVLVRVFMGKNVLFRQQRPGLNGKIFSLYKFRTLGEGRDSDGKLLPDELRTNRFGLWLRATSLDELPGLFNVLKGDMSLVGPRPLLVDYLPLYSEQQARRHEVRPGITGWAQVNGRNALSWEQKFDFDVWYVDNHSFSLDIKIMLMTVVKVLKRDSISADGVVGMERFEGNQ